MNFIESLDKQADDIKRPPILPIGTYEWQVKKYDFDKSQDGKWEFCTFHLNCTGVQDDVDPDALADYGRPQGSYMRYAFLFDTEDSARFQQTENRLKRFLTDTLKCWDGGSLKQGIDNAVGKKFLGQLRWRQNKQDPELQDAEISKTAPIV